MARDAGPQPADSIQRLFELSEDMLGTATLDGFFTRLNPAWEHALGWTREELMATPFISFVHPDDVEATMARAEQLRDPGVAVAAAFENRYRARDGSYRRIQWTTVAEDGVIYFVAKDVTERHDDEESIRYSEALHRSLTGNLPDTTVYLLDRDLRILIADGESIRRLPWLEEDKFRGRKVAELYGEVPPEVLGLCLENYNAALAGERREFEFESDGLTFAIQAVPINGEHGTVASVLVVARDVTERARAEEQIARAARLQSAVADLGRFALESQDLSELMNRAVTLGTATLGVEIGGVLELDAAGRNLTVRATTGFPDGVPDRFPLGDSMVAHTLRTGEPTVIEDISTDTRFEPPPLLRKIGVVSVVCVPIEAHGRAFGVFNLYTRDKREFAPDEVAFLTAVARLIVVAVERDRQEEATRHAALHDPLTGLPNRTLALDRLAHALARRAREHIDVAVYVVDVDGFKMINDSFGHAAGDDVLLSLAPRLIAALRATDTVARLGGDEFVVICPDVDGTRGAAEAAERLAASVIRPMVLDSGEHFFTITTGIALAAGRADTPESLLGDADAAMYRAKARGRGRYELFDEEMRISAMTRMRTEAELRHALTRGELEVWYQPVIDLATGTTVSTEALVRWRHPERGLIPPLEFIGIAEETGLISELGLQVLEQACVQTAAWQKRFDPALAVSVNASGRQAMNPMFPAQVAAVAQESGIAPGTLALEITETVLMEDSEAAETVLGRFPEHGVSLVLDDFGTGYSSLSRLKRFPLDELKIDRSFVSGVEHNSEDRAIVQATIDMAHAVGLTVVAEGVETSEQEGLLRAFGCDRAQGYLYAKPQPAAGIIDMLAAAPR